MAAAPGRRKRRRTDERGAREGVFLHAGSEFYAKPNRNYPDNYWPPASHIRLAYSFASLEEIDEGVTRLARGYESIIS